MKVIYAEAAKQALIGWSDNPSDEEIEMAIDALPAALVEPVRHGRWEEYPDKAHLRCTACKLEFPRNKLPETRNRCPNCGAKMDAKENEP